MSLKGKNGQSIPVLAYAVRREQFNDCVFVAVHQRQKYEEEILAARRKAEDALRNNEALKKVQNELEIQTEELARSKALADQKNRELLQVTHILFHHLREPIRKIQTFSSLLSETIQPEEAEFSLSRIRAACDGMDQLLRILQQFVTIGEGDCEFSQVDLNSVIIGAFHFASNRYPECQADFEMEELPRVEGSSRQLEILFRELFDNAFKFRSPVRPLKIQISGTTLQENRLRQLSGHYRYADYVQILFKDNGIGLAGEYRESAFELLNRLDPANPLPGCGLAICKKVIENHYGAISVVPGMKEGTTFKILLPLRQEA